MRITRGAEGAAKRETGDMSKPTIPETVRTQVDDMVTAFNKNSIKDPNRFYTTRFQGLFLYLDRVDFETESQICRLKYSGDIAKWEFAIYKYSSSRYDPDEWFFTGAGHVDGTVEGAMKAGLEAYP